MNLDFTPSLWKNFTDVQITHSPISHNQSLPIELIYFYTVHNIKLQLFKFLFLFWAHGKDSPLLFSLKIIEVGGSTLLKVPHVDRFLQ